MTPRGGIYGDKFGDGQLVERPLDSERCPSCGGHGDGPGGRCIYTGEIVDGPCPDCDGTGKRKPATT